MLPQKLNKISIGILSLFAIGIVWILVISSCLTFSPLNSVRGGGYPGQAVEYIQKHGCQGGNIFNSYDFGGYLIWKLPTQKVYIDGRMPDWRDEAGQRYMDRYFKVYRDKEYQKSQFGQYNIRCALVQKTKDNKNLLSWLKEAGWQSVVDSGGSNLLIAPK